jgi:heterogeneous nuclear ribonucleoprotein R
LFFFLSIHYQFDDPNEVDEEKEVEYEEIEEEVEYEEVEED